MIKAKPICALVSTITCQSIVGSIFFYISFIPYRYSQMLESNPKLKPDSLNYVIPIAFLFFCGLRFVGLFINEKLGPRICTVIGEVLILFAIFLLWASKNYVGDHFIMVIYGIGAGFMYFPSQINLFKYYSNSKLKIILRSSFGLCGIIIAAFFSVLVNIIVNPKGLGPTWISQTGEKFYEESVTMNINFYLLIYLAIIGGLCILSIGVMLPATKDDIDAEVNNENLIPSQEDDKEKNNNEVPDNKKVQVPHKLSENENNYENMPDHFKQEDFDDTRSLQKTKKTALLSATTSCKMFLYFLVMLLLALYPVTALMTFTLFGYKHNISDVSLSWGLFIYLLMWGVSCPLWALFYSNFKYSYAIYLICAIQLGLGASFYFAVESTVAFLMVVGVSGVGMGFIHQIYPIHLQAIFGFENGIFCFSYATISLPIAGLIGTFLYNYIEHNLKGQYTLWMYGISAVINVLIAFMALVIKEKKFKYDDAY